MRQQILVLRNTNLTVLSWCWWIYYMCLIYVLIYLREVTKEVGNKEIGKVENCTCKIWLESIRMRTHGNAIGECFCGLPILPLAHPSWWIATEAGAVSWKKRIWRNVADGLVLLYFPWCNYKNLNEENYQNT